MPKVKFFIASGFWFHNILYIYFGFSTNLILQGVDVIAKRGGISLVIHLFKLGFSFSFHPIKLKPER
jgi:hypothetical protein